MATCKYCGNDLLPGATVCRFCGGEVPPEVWQQEASGAGGAVQATGAAGQSIGPAVVGGSPPGTQGGSSTSSWSGSAPAGQAPQGPWPSSGGVSSSAPGFDELLAGPGQSGVRAAGGPAPSGPGAQAGFGGAGYGVSRQPSWPQAGAPGQVAGARPAKSRAVYIVLAVLFGGLGIHNFYAERFGRGVIQLVLTVLFFWLIIPILVVFVWVLVDILTVTSDGHGVPFD